MSILSKTTIKSTNEILEELQKRTERVINWYALYRVLMELREEGKIETMKFRPSWKSG